MSVQRKQEHLEAKTVFPTVDQHKEYTLAPGLAMTLCTQRREFTDIAIATEKDPRVKVLMELAADLAQDKMDLQKDLQLYKDAWHEAMLVVEDVRRIAATYINKECG